MKKYIFFFLIITSQLLNGQTPITSGMSGLQMRNALNANFDTIFKGNNRYGIEIGRYKHNNRIDSAIIQGTNIKLYHGSTVLNTGGTYFNVKDYGAIGNGITDDRTAITDCINAAMAINGTVYFPSGTYYISETIQINYDNKKITIVGEQGVLLKGNSGSVYLRFLSTAGTAKTFTSNLYKNQRTLTLNDVSDISVGDLLEIRSTDEWINIGISSVSKGEFVVVNKIVGTTLTLNRGLYDDYNYTTTNVRKSNPGEINMSGLNFNNIGVDIAGAQNSTIYNCRFISDTYQPVAVADCYNMVLENLSVQHGQGYTNSDAYAISGAAYDNLKITGCIVSGYTQAILVGGQKRPGRNYICSYNTISAPSGNGIDIHAQNEFSLVFANTLYGCRIYAKGNYTDIVSNEIVNGTIIRLREDLTNSGRFVINTGYENIINNKIYTVPDSAITGEIIGINIQNNNYRDTIDFVNISGNYVNVTGYAFLFSADTNDDVYYRNININNNSFETTGGTQYTIFFAGGGIDIDKVKFDNNIIRNLNFDPMHLTNGAQINEAIFTNNTFESSNGQMWSVVPQNNTWIGNTIISTRTNIRADGGRLIFKDNILQGATNPSYQHVIIGTLVTPISVLIQDNVIQTNTLKPYYVSGGSLSVTIRDETGYFTGSLTDNNPSQSEIQTVVGYTAIDMLNGYKAIIKDSDGSEETYVFQSNGFAWIKLSGGSLVTGNLTESITGLEFDQTRSVIGGAAALSLTSGYTIPTTTQISNAGTAYSWGNHASAGYAASSHTQAQSTITGLTDSLLNKYTKLQSNARYSPTPIDDILDWSTNKYTPYAAQTTGKFDVSTTKPIATNRLNYDGAFHATRINTDTVKTSNAASGNGSSLYLKAGDAGASATGGNVILEPGKTTTGAGYDIVAFGRSANSASAWTQMQVRNSGTNAGFWFINKGTSAFMFEPANNIRHALSTTALVFNSTNDFDIYINPNTDDLAGKNLRVIAGNADATAAEDLDGGDIVISAGDKANGGLTGDLYLKTSSSIPYVKDKTTETEVLYYNSTSGLVSKGAAGSGGVSISDVSDLIADSLNARLSAATSIEDEIALSKLVTDTLRVTSATYTFVLTDVGKTIRGYHATFQKFTVPLNSSVAFPIGTVITVKQDGAGPIKFAPASGVVFKAPLDSLTMNTRYSWVQLIKQATNKWEFVGRLED